MVLTSYETPAIDTPNPQSSIEPSLIASEIDIFCLLKVYVSMKFSAGFMPKVIGELFEGIEMYVYS